jgi:3-hydroxymyristoyl/3-hydroxydecanoyl-(acyl carrier protein) dehydratase
MSGFDNLDNVTLIEKTENSVSVEFSIPDSNPYFDGHFPGFPILPAVAQTELVLRFALRYLGTGVGLSEIRRIKFISLLRPFEPLLLKLVKKENTISFNLSSPGGETVYSTGTVILEKE